MRVVSLRQTQMKSCWRPLTTFRKWMYRRCSQLNLSPGSEKTLTKSLVGPSICPCVCHWFKEELLYEFVCLFVCVALMMWIIARLTQTSLRPAAVPSLLSRWQRRPLCPGWAVDRPAWVPVWYVSHTLSVWNSRMMSRDLTHAVQFCFNLQYLQNLF